MTVQLLLTLGPENELQAAWRDEDGHLKTVRPPASWHPVVQQWLEGQTPAHNLSGREAQVLSGLVHGQSYKQIAYDLEISIDTVRAHIKNLYRKLGVRSVAEAVAYALRRGLVD